MKCIASDSGTVDSVSSIFDSPDALGGRVVPHALSGAIAKSKRAGRIETTTKQNNSYYKITLVTCWSRYSGGYKESCKDKLTPAAYSTNDYL